MRLLFVVSACLGATSVKQLVANDVFSHYEKGLKLIQAGDHRAAGAEFDAAIKQAPTHFGRGARGSININTARLMQFRANCHLNTFELLHAEKLYLTCLKVAEAEGGNDGGQLRHECLSSLGVVATRQGQWALAEERFKDALQDARDPESRATTQNNLASLQLLRDDVQGADLAYEKALELWASTDGPGKQLGLASSRHGRGVIALKKGEFKKALPLFETALATRNRELPPNHRFIGHSIEMCGITIAHLGDFEAGIRKLRQAEQIMKSYWGDTHVEVAEVQHELALNLAMKGEVTEAAEQMTRSRKGYRDHLNGVLAGLSQSEQLRFLKTERHRFMDGLALAHLHAQHPDIPQLSWEWVVNGKGLSFEILAERHLLERDSLLSGGAADTVRELADVRRQLASLSTVPGVRLEASQQQLSDREARLTRDLGLRLNSGGASQWTSHKSVLERLSPGTLLIDFAFVDRASPSSSGFVHPTKNSSNGRYLAWVISGDHDTVRLFDLGPSRVVDQQVAELRRAIEQSPATITQDPISAAARINEQLRQLSTLLCGPFLSDVAAAENVIICPDASLWFVPWSALLLPDGRYLVEQAGTSLVVSARQVLTGERLPCNPYAVMMADPDFDLRPEDVQSRIQRAKLAPDRLPTRSSVGKLSTVPRNLQRLPGTLAEAEAAEPLLTQALNSRVYLYTGTSALETFVKIIRRPRIAMFATHGFFLDGALETTNPLMRCGLTFAGANQRNNTDSFDNGILTGLEVLDCDFRGTELVVLSACDTALGASTDGEGVAGLQTAFQLAGAEQVMATLWQVSDRDTASLMQRFWKEHVDQRTAFKALRDAQLTYIEASRSRHGHAHPWLWAAMQVVGMSR
ncbi:MAG: CHAT domain-containing tetratricopeptide repeat protein [Fuerstiella sp.]